MMLVPCKRAVAQPVLVRQARARLFAEDRLAEVQSAARTAICRERIFKPSKPAAVAMSINIARWSGARVVSCAAAAPFGAARCAFADGQTRTLGSPTVVAGRGSPAMALARR